MDRPTEDEIFEWVIAYLGGKTLPEIAEYYGYSRTTVRKYLLLEGIELRPRGQPVKGKMERTGTCKRGHDLTVFGVVRPCATGRQKTRVTCLQCDRDRHNAKYNDPEYAEKKRQKMKEYRERKKREKEKAA